MIIVVEIVLGAIMIGSPGTLGASKNTPKPWAAPKPPAPEWAEAVDRAKRTNVVDLAAQRVELRKTAGREWEGPCPKCGGTDRLHVKADGWFCRQCKPIDAGGHGWHDAITWIQFVSSATFDDAVTALTGVRRDPSEKATRNISTVTTTRAIPTMSAPTPQTDEWRAKAQPIVEAAQAALMAGDNAGATYLIGRGLASETWAVFGFGFGSFRGHPAIVIPWTRGGKLQAIRYRFLQPVDGKKIMSEPGSRFADSMYGGQALIWCMEHKRTLVICEGEINAASIWQAAHESYLDVLSLGSESAMLPKSALEYAAKFRACIVWMDKADIARKWADMIPGAIAVASPNGMDANDMLKAGKLGAFLGGVRLKASNTPEKREALKWDLWDQQHLGSGVEDETARLIEGMLCHS